MVLRSDDAEVSCSWHGVGADRHLGRRRSAVARPEGSRPRHHHRGASQGPVPSTSVAIVVDGELAYAEAFGLAQLDPARPATPATRYDIGSVSKQFTAAAVMLLVQDGKLSLDDKVGRFFPSLAGADKVTVRHLLSHTAGYRDSWQDTSEARRRPITPQAIVDRWGAMPLAFEPGSAWDYSNTNYAIAGRIVETVSGQTLNQVLSERIFRPLGMTSAIDNEAVAPNAQDAARYTRNLLGPARSVEPAARGWAFGAGGLSMTASDLARWDANVLARSLLAPASYEAMMRETTLTTGKGSGYGLGLYVDGAPGHRRVYHNGFAPGVITENRIYPDDGVAVVVTANAEFGMVVPDIADGVEKLLLPVAFPRPEHLWRGREGGRAALADGPSPRRRTGRRPCRLPSVDSRGLRLSDARAPGRLPREPDAPGSAPTLRRHPPGEDRRRRWRHVRDDLAGPEGDRRDADQTGRQGLGPVADGLLAGARITSMGFPPVMRGTIMAHDPKTPTNDNDTHPAGQEAPPPPALDPNKKTDATHDPTATDPGNGAD
ncbi:serine hydrolase domain-containing protein [Caulobacter segnis]